MLSDGPAKLGTDTLLVGEGSFGSHIRDEFDASHQALVADIANEIAVPELFQPFGKALDFGAKFFDNFLLLEYVKVSQSGSTGQGVSGIGVAMVEGASGSSKGIEYFLTDEGGSQRQVTGGNAFSQAEQVGLYVLVMAGKHFSGSTKTDGDFVGNEQDTVLAGYLADSVEVARGGDDDSSGTLDDGLDNDGGDLVCVFREDLVNFVGAGEIAGFRLKAQFASVTVWRGGQMGLEEQGGKDLVEKVDSAEADGADGVSVVAVAQSEEAFARLTQVLPILEGDFGSNFHGG